MEQSASQAETLNGAGRKRADLATEEFAKSELGGQRTDALPGHGRGKAIELAEEKEILASGEAGIEAVIGAGVIAELAADVPRMREGVVASDAGAAGGRKEQGGDNTQQRGLACAVGSEEGDGLAFADLQGHVRQRGNACFFKGLEESAPTAARGREGLVERFDGNGRWSHQETYNVSGPHKTMRLDGHTDAASIATTRSSGIACAARLVSRPSQRMVRSGVAETWIE